MRDSNRTYSKQRIRCRRKTTALSPRRIFGPFARVVNHVTEAQLHICGAANNTDPSALPKVPAETADKAAIVEALKASFAECDKAYAGVTDANLTDMLQAGPAGKRSRLSMLWGNVAHDNEQYAILSLYLRLKGLVPPSSEK